MAAFWRRGNKTQPVEPPKVRPAVCVSGEEAKVDVGVTYDNSNITMAAWMPGMDYRAILMDKQAHIYDLYA